jgi:hypothetical protein
LVPSMRCLNWEWAKHRPRQLPSG